MLRNLRSLLRILLVNPGKIQQGYLVAWRNDKLQRKKYCIDRGVMCRVEGLSYRELRG